MCTRVLDGCLDLSKGHYDLGDAFHVKLNVLILTFHFLQHFFYIFLIHCNNKAQQCNVEKDVSRNLKS